MMRFIQDLIDNETGATAIEYGLICAMIVVAMMAALSSVGAQTSAMWTKIADTSGEAMRNAGQP